jgi:hypothetical protein
VSLDVMTSIKSFKTGQLVVNRMKTDKLDYKSVFFSPSTNTSTTHVENSSGNLNFPLISPRALF